MPMTEQEILEKAAMVVADLTPGGLLNPEQTNRFIRDAIEASTIAREARVEPMNSPQALIEKIGFASRILTPAVEATAPDQTVKPATGKVTLTTSEIIAPVDISYSTLEDNIERARLENTIMELLSQRTGIDLEELYVNADTDNAEDAYLALQDGWLKRAGHVYNHNNSPFSAAAVFGTILRQLPKKYLRNKRDWRFYVHPDVEDLYRDQLAERATAAGDRFTLDDAPVLYKGVPVVSVHTLATEEVDDGEGGTFTTSPVLLAHPKNLIVGIQRRINVETERVPRRRVLELTLTTRVAVAVEESNALVKATGVKHSLE